jgi:hypothetical protein
MHSNILSWGKLGMRHFTYYWYIAYIKRTKCKNLAPSPGVCPTSFLHQETKGGSSTITTMNFKNVQ